MSDNPRKGQSMPSGWWEVVGGSDCVAIIGTGAAPVIVTPAEARRLADALIVQAGRVEDYMLEGEH